MLNIGSESKGLNALAEEEELSDGVDEERDDPRLDQACGRRYRGVVARAHDLSQDQIDLQFAPEEACRQMSNRMKRIARYLLK